MKIAVVYESIYGNTAAVAQAVAEGLRALGEVDVRAVGDESVEADLLVVGAPTHAHGLPSSMTRKAIEAAAEEAEAKGDPLDYQPTAGMRKFLERLPEVDGTAAACFDTRFDKSRILTGSAAKTMARRLGHRGYSIVAEPESFFVLDAEGPLREGELDRASRWGASLGTAVGVRH
jgi:multimeric flavodoxin WrbA